MSTIVGCPSCKSRLAIKNNARATVVCPTCNFSIVLAPGKAASTVASPQPSPSVPQQVSQLDSQAATPKSPIQRSPPSKEGAAGRDHGAAGFDLSMLSKPTTNSVATSLAPAKREAQEAPQEKQPQAADVVGNPDSQLPLAAPAQLAMPTRQLASIPPPQMPADSAADATVSDELAGTRPPSEFSFESPIVGSVHATILHRKKRQRLNFLAINSLLALITLAIVGVLYWRLTVLPEVASPTSEAPSQQTDQTPNPKSTSEQQPLTSRNSEAADSLSSQTADGSTRTDPVAGEESLIAIQPPPAPVFRFFNPKQVSEFWKITKPNLVSLKIDGPLGQRQAVGLIVDSRGWIVTSHQAVKDATRIEVSAAIEPLNQPADSQEAPLVDLVRGLVIDDPENDLAILAINRRFVVSLAEPDFVDKDRLVEQLRLLAVAPPSQANYYGVAEVHVTQRNTRDQLPLAIKSKLDLLGLGRPDLSWITVAGSTQWLPGTPLIDTQGQAQAIVTMPRENNLALAISLAPLRKLLKQASGEIKPLKLNLGQADNGDTVLLDSSHPAQLAVVALQAAADHCRDFGWLPQTAEHFQVLVDFCNQYIASQELLEDYENDYRDSAATQATYKSLDQLIRQLADEIETKIGQALDQDKTQLAQLNQFAEERLTRSDPTRVAAASPNKHQAARLAEPGPDPSDATRAQEQDSKMSTPTLIPMFVQVIEGGLQLDQFLVQLDGLETSCVIPFDPVARPLRPGTYWLLIVETTQSSRRKIYKLPKNRSIEAYSALQKSEFGPLQGPGR